MLPVGETGERKARVCVQVGVHVCVCGALMLARIPASLSQHYPLSALETAEINTRNKRIIHDGNFLEYRSADTWWCLSLTLICVAFMYSVWTGECAAEYLITWLTCNLLVREEEEEAERLNQTTTTWPVCGNTAHKTHTHIYLFIHYPIHPRIYLQSHPSIHAFIHLSTHPPTTALLAIAWTEHLTETQT